LRDKLYIEGAAKTPVKSEKMKVRQKRLVANKGEKPSLRDCLEEGS